MTVTGSRFQFSADGRSLTVSNVQVEDEGVYVCSATNPAATRTDTVSLNVIGEYYVIYNYGQKISNNILRRKKNITSILNNVNNVIKIQSFWKAVKLQYLH